MPEADADAEVVLHPLAEDEPVRLVDLERERIVGAEPRERDPALHVGEELAGHACLLSSIRLHPAALLRPAPRGYHLDLCDGPTNPAPFAHWGQATIVSNPSDA